VKTVSLGVILTIRWIARPRRALGPRRRRGGPTGGRGATPPSAERALVRWREARAADIAGRTGFHDPRDAARLADLGAAHDESVTRALKVLAAERPYLLRYA
jgi:hypothetical protein